MNKKLIIALVVVIVAAGAFFILRNQKKAEEQKKIATKAYTKLVEISKKNSQAGLPQMGGALKNYYKKYHVYPAQLDDLYPEFIPIEQFITDLNWYYEPRGNDFFLSKTITRGKKQLVVSIDKNMNPQKGTGTMVAAARKPEKPVEQIEPEATSPTLALKPIETIQPIEPMTVEEPESQSMMEHPEIVSMVEGEIGHGIPSSVSRKLLVWRDKNGVLGFGNVIYPDTQKLTIYKDGSWINIKKPPQNKQVATPQPTPQKPKGAEAIAPDYSKKYLVWKDKKGNIGYGNVQYPGIEDIAYICVNGSWQKVVN